MSGHSMKHGEADGTIGDRMIGYFSARAAGGAALVSLESIPVHESSHNFDRQIRLFSDDCLPGLKRLAKSVHEHGSKVSAILWHGGPNVSHFGRGPSFAPSPIPAPGTGEIAKEMTVGDIWSVIEGYRKAATRCLEAGFDAVEIQTASNYLLGSFLSPVLNRRKDRYGGSEKNRRRFVIEVLETVREAVDGRLAVGVRTTVEPVVDDGSESIKDVSLRTMEELKARGLIDWVSLINGSAYSRGTSIPTMDLPRAFMANHAARFRSSLGIPVIMAGRVRRPLEAESLLSDSKVDVIAMARSWIVEPDWIKKTELGQEDRIRPCISCNQGCLGFNHRNKPGTCVVNPIAGREFSFPALTPARVSKRIAVIGGGPGGLETARIAALRGHKVTLYEAQKTLGGSMRLAGTAPYREEILNPIKWWEQELTRLGVDIGLNRNVSSDEDLHADEVVWAIGGQASQLAVLRRRPTLIDGIPGADTLPHGRDVLKGIASVKGKILIIDEEGAWPTISLAESINADPEVSEVTVATPAGQWGLPDLHMTAEIGSAMDRIQASKINVLENTTVASVQGNLAKTTDGRELGPFDDIVLATGTTASPVPTQDHAVGDCVSPRGIWAAVHDAVLLARSL